LYYFLKEKNSLLIIIALFFLVTLVVIKSGTGLALLILAFFILSFYTPFKYRVFILTLMAISLASSIIYLYQFYNSHFKLSPDFILKKKTQNHQIYTHFMYGKIFVKRNCLSRGIKFPTSLIMATI
jgi:hypothetical protein